MNILDMVGRNKELFESDLVNTENCIQGKVLDSKFLVIGGAGSIGQAVTKEVFKLDPQAPHIVNISENNMVELVRDLPSIEGYGSGDFKTFSVGSGSVEFEALMASEGSYDCVFNLNHRLLGGCN
jgi:FlaA1/EpsC-like NDP-sugar epimerase